MEPVQLVLFRLPQFSEVRYTAIGSLGPRISRCHRPFKASFHRSIVNRRCIGLFLCFYSGIGRSGNPVLVIPCEGRTTVSEACSIGRLVGPVIGSGSVGSLRGRDAAGTTVQEGVRRLCIGLVGVRLAHASKGELPRTRGELGLIPGQELRVEATQHTAESRFVSSKGQL